MKWIDMGKEYKNNGDATRFFCEKSGRFTIEVRRWLSGGYYMVSYWLIDKKDGTEKQFRGVMSAKEAAEEKMKQDD